MDRYLHFLISLVFATTSLTAGAQETTNVRRLFDELNRPKTTAAAARRILELAGRDQNARTYVVQRLPAMIRDGEVGPVWLNAVRLAGQLKSSEAVSVLMDALSRGNVDQGSVTMAEYMHLDTDVVAKALAEIGDPSVPAVASLVKLGDKNARHRAVLILLNINTSVSKKALSDYLPNERDPDIKKLIEDGMRGASSRF